MLKIYRLYCTIYSNQLQEKYYTNEWMEMSRTEVVYILYCRFCSPKTVERDADCYPPLRLNRCVASNRN